MRSIVTVLRAEDREHALLRGDSHRPDRSGRAHHFCRPPVDRPANCAGVANPEGDVVVSPERFVFAGLHRPVDGARPVDSRRDPRGGGRVEFHGNPGGRRAGGAVIRADAVSAATAGVPVPAVPTVCRGVVSRAGPLRSVTASTMATPTQSSNTVIMPVCAPSYAGLGVGREGALSGTAQGSCRRRELCEEIPDGLLGIFSEVRSVSPDKAAAVRARRQAPTVVVLDREEIPWLDPQRRRDIRDRVSAPFSCCLQLGADVHGHSPSFCRVT